jgi:hypothetical protein
MEERMPTINKAEVPQCACGFLVINTLLLKGMRAKSHKIFGGYIAFSCQSTS